MYIVGKQSSGGIDQDLRLVAAGITYLIYLR